MRKFFIILTLFGLISTLSYPSFASADMSMDMQSCMKMMSNGLGPKDAYYDKRFIDEMIPHHEGAIAMAKDALKNSTRPELRKLAKNIIKAQEAEIEQMKQWRKEWYNK